MTFTIASIHMAIRSYHQWTRQRSYGQMKVLRESSFEVISKPLNRLPYTMQPYTICSMLYAVRCTLKTTSFRCITLLTNLHAIFIDRYKLNWICVSQTTLIVIANSFWPALKLLECSSETKWKKKRTINNLFINFHLCEKIHGNLWFLPFFAFCMSDHAMKPFLFHTFRSFKLPKKITNYNDVSKCAKYAKQSINWIKFNFFEH